MWKLTDKDKSDQLDTTASASGDAEITEPGNSVPGQGDELVGTLVAGKFEIISLLGKGGMSVVYKTKHKLINKVTAIKMMLPHLVSSESSRMRFQQEAQASATLDHPNVIGVYDFGFTADGTAYLVMDYLEGESLSEIIEREGALPVERAVPIFLQAADALAHAHEKGIIHRDLKPSNIMILKDSEGGEHVRLVDFGIAKLLPQSGEEVQALTQTGELFGSPLYMSPEQAIGKSLDKRLDIYSMGCLMYEALTGQLPHQGETTLDTMLKHMNAEPKPFKKVSENLNIPKSIEAIVFKCLEKKPEDRYQSMNELKQELKVAMEGGGALQATKGIITRKLGRRMTRRLSDPKTGLFLIGLLLISMLAGAFFFTKFELATQKITPEGEALQEWSDYDEKGRKALAEDNLTEADRYFTGAVRSARTSANSNVEIISLKYLARVKAQEGLEKQSRELFDQARRLETKGAEDAYAGSDDDLRKNIYSILEEAAAHKKLAEKSKSRKERSLNRKKLLKDTVKLKNFIKQAHNRSDFDKTVSLLYQRIMELEETALGPNNLEVARTDNAFGEYLLAQGKPKRALDKFRESLRTTEEHCGVDSSKSAPILNNMAKASAAMKDYDQAEAFHKRADIILQKTYTNDDPAALCIMNDHAQFLREQNREQDAAKIESRITGAAK